MNEDAGIDRQDALDSLEFTVAAFTTATQYVGFRIWRLIDGALWSPYRRDCWEQPVLEASCRGLTGSAERLGLGPLPVPHRSPDRRCSCGIYVSHVPNVAFSQLDFRGVTGIVTVWGAILPEDDGARAEFARVAALGVYPHWTERQKEAVTAAARRLEADVVNVDALERVAQRYGARLPARSLA